MAKKKETMRLPAWIILVRIALAENLSRLTNGNKVADWGANENCMAANQARGAVWLAREVHAITNDEATKLWDTMDEVFGIGPGFRAPQPTKCHVLRFNTLVSALRMSHTNTLAS